MIKVANLNISQDNCGLYVIRLKGTDASFFRVINNELWFTLQQPNICKTSYIVIVSVEDLAGRFTPLTRTFTLNTPNCFCTSTTTTTTTTTTLIPATSTTTTITTTTTSTTTNSPIDCLARYSRGISNLTNFGSYYTGSVTGSFSGGPVWGTNQHGYTDDSDFSVAAVHAGLVSVGQTATIKFTILGTKTNFPSSTANGVTTLSWLTSWCAIQLSSF